MNLWHANRETRRYPPLRVVWNLIWFLPLYISRVLFTLVVFLENGSEYAKNAWLSTQ